MEYLKSKIRTVKDWPKKGIMFRDISTLLAHPTGLNGITYSLKQVYQDVDIDYIAGIEARGFIIGSALAQELGKGFIMIRKKGKLPPPITRATYELEYGEDSIEIEKDLIPQNSKVLIIDDLIATGGTLLAACKLIETTGSQVIGCAAVIDLPDLKGSEKLRKAGYKVHTLLEFKGK